MAIKLVKQKKLERKYAFNLTAEEVDKLITREAEKLQSKIKKDGFRKGKVPIDLIKEEYLKNLIEKAVFGALESELSGELEKDDFKLATDFKVEEEIALDKVEDIKFTVNIESMPVVPEIDYRKIELTKPILVLTEKEMEEQLKQAADKVAKLEEIKDSKHKIKKHDSVDIHFEGFVDNVPFEGGKAENHVLEIGSGSFIPGFEDQLLGKQVGEDVEVNVVFPEEYNAKELAGKNAMFKVKINKAFGKKTPAIDDEMAKSLKFKDLADLKEKITTESKKSFDKAFNNSAKKQILEFIIKKNNFELPPSIVEKEVGEKIKLEKEKTDKKNQKSEKDIKAEVEQHLRNGYFLQDFISKNKLDVKEDDIKNYIADQYGDLDADYLAQFLQAYTTNKHLLQSMHSMILESKFLNKVLSLMDIKEQETKKSDFEALLKDISEGKKAIAIKAKTMFSK